MDLQQGCTLSFSRDQLQVSPNILVVVCAANMISVVLSAPGVRSNSVGGRTAINDTTTGHGGASMYSASGNLSGHGTGDPGSTVSVSLALVAVSCPLFSP